MRSAPSTLRKDLGLKMDNFILKISTIKSWNATMKKMKNLLNYSCVISELWRSRRNQEMSWIFLPFSKI